MLRVYFLRRESDYTDLSKPEVEDFTVNAMRDKNVGGLDLTMNDSLTLSVLLIAIHDTPRNAGRSARSSRPAHKSIRSALESGFGR